MESLVNPIVDPQAGIPPHRPVYFAAKRLFDLLLSALGLIAVSPVLLLAAVAVKIDSRGPVFFCQQRMGRGLRPFKIIKLRTMVVDAATQGPHITTTSDRRVTRVGRWLREYKIDELPELINVLIGDMSFVGPRPEVPRYVEFFRSDFEYLLSVRPGITDPSSIKYRHESDLLAQAENAEQEYLARVLPDKIAIARDYVARASFVTDLACIWQTMRTLAH